MPYKDIEKRRVMNRYRNSKQITVVCELCGVEYKIRKDTTYKDYRRVCLNCKSKNLKMVHLTNIDEIKFIEEYLASVLGYQTLCKKYNIGSKRGKQILNDNKIELIRKPVWNKGTGKKGICKVCNNEFRLIGRKIYCSKKCQVKDEDWKQIQRNNTIIQIKQGHFSSMNTSIEIIIESLLKKHSLNYEKQFIVGYWSLIFY